MPSQCYTTVFFIVLVGLQYGHAQDVSNSRVLNEYQVNGNKAITGGSVEGESQNGGSIKGIPAAGRSTIPGTSAACGRPAVPGSAVIATQPTQTTIGKWPWQVSIWRFQDLNAKIYLWCTGTLIGKQWVLTAARCFDEKRLSFTLVAFGRTDFSTAENGSDWRAVGSVFCHPSYDSKTRVNDICLIKLSTEIHYNDKIRPVCLPDEADVISEGDKCVLTGWNVPKSSTSRSRILQETKIQILPKQNCNSLLNGKQAFPTDHFCAGTDNQIIGPCVWLEGDPIVCNNSVNNVPTYTLRGVMSLNVSGCNSATGRPGGFTNVEKYRTWLSSTMTKSPSVSICFDASTIRSCGSIIKTNNTVIRSPVVDMSTWLYPPNTNCSWTIQAPFAHKIHFDFICFINTETVTSTPVNSCNDDYFLISKGEGGSMSYCGRLSPGINYTTSSNRAVLEFHSDSDKLTSQGFVARITFIPPTDAELSICYNETAIHSCGKVITKNNTLIRSPIGDNNTWFYPSNIDCEWDVHAPDGYGITFEFLCSFNTNNEKIGSCSHDYLKIIPNGYAGNSYCGPHKTLEPYETKSNKAKLKFHSESNAKTRPGFVIRAVFKKLENAFVISQKCYNQSSIYECDNYITANDSVIRSPVVNTNTWIYPRDTDCTWFVQAPKGCNLMFVFDCFLDFDSPISSTFLGCNDDYLLIEPTNKGGNKYCGTHAYQEPYNITGNSAIVKFHSRFGSDGGKGFVVRVLFKCGSTSYRGSVGFILLVSLIGLLINN